MKLFKKMTQLSLNPWFIIGFFSLLTLSYIGLDKPIAEFFFKLQLGNNIHGLALFTELGKSWIYVALFGILAITFRFFYPQKTYEMHAWFLMLCVFIPNVMCLFLKVGLGRARPELWLKYHQYGFYWFKTSKLYWSFPSSHTCTITGLFIGLMLIFPSLSLFLLLPALLLIASRIVLYQHFLSDVLAAMYVTFIVIGILVYCIREKKWFISAK